jgi:hypothetical protein
MRTVGSSDSGLQQLPSVDLVICRRSLVGSVLYQCGWYHCG